MTEAEEASAWLLARYDRDPRRNQLDPSPGVSWMRPMFSLVDDHPTSDCVETWCLHALNVAVWVADRDGVAA